MLDVWAEFNFKAIHTFPLDEKHSPALYGHTDEVSCTCFIPK